MKKLNKQLADVDLFERQIDEPQQSIGLINVLKRLQLFFGNDTKLEISANKMNGITISLLIPIRGDQSESSNS